MVKTSPLLGGEAKGSFTRAALAGVSCLALLCLALSARSLSTQTELADVAVDGTSFPSYYGGQSLANPAVSYPDMNIAGAGSLAAAPSFNVAPGQKLDDMCGGGTAAVTLCSSFLPAAGVAAAPYMTPSLSSWGGGCGQGPCGGGAGSNTYQAPTVWNGDHVLGGGQPEWATEDAAQHALNLANWRIKLLQAKLEQAKLASRVMNVGDAQTHYLQAQAGSAQKQVASPEQMQLKSMKRGLVSLADSTSKAIEALADKISHDKPAVTVRAKHTARKHKSYVAKLREVKSSTDKQLAAILAKIDNISSN